MDFTKTEALAIEEVVSQVEKSFGGFAELELTMVGSGLGDIVLA